MKDVEEITKCKCTICEQEDPEGGTRHLVMSGGACWIEFCRDCGESACVVSRTTGEGGYLADIFDEYKTHETASVATMDYIH